MTLSISEEKPQITDFLSRHQIGTLATANKEGVPHAVAVYFAIDADLNVYFITKETTTKARNIKENPNVAFAVFEPVSQTTVQIVGQAVEIDDITRANEVFRRILGTTATTSETTVPPVSKIVGGEYKLFRINPHTIRMAVYTRPEHGEFGNIFDAVVVPEGDNLG